LWRWPSHHIFLVDYAASMQRKIISNVGNPWYLWLCFLGLPTGSLHLDSVDCKLLFFSSQRGFLGYVWIIMDILYAQYVEGFLCMCSYYSDDSTSFTTQTTQKEASVHVRPSILSKILSNLLNATFYCSDSKFALILFTKNSFKSCYQMMDLPNFSNDGGK